MNGTSFVLMRAEQVVAKEAGAFAGYGGPVWTLDRRYVAALEGDDYYTAGTQKLVVIDVSSGTIHNLPCLGCTSIVGVGGSQLVAITDKPGASRTMLRFDLASPAPPVEVTMQLPQSTRAWLVAGMVNQVLVASTTGADSDDKLFTMSLIRNSSHHAADLR